MKLDEMTHGASKCSRKGRLKDGGALAERALEGSGREDRSTGMTDREI